MSIFFERVASVLCAACAIAGTTSGAHAGPLPPCIVATLSANHSILVVNEQAYDGLDETQAQRPRTSTFRVLRSYIDENEALRLNGPDKYWANSLWSVVFTDSGKTPLIFCPYTLVTDDGEFLVLISDNFGPPALSIYRRRDHPGLSSGGSGPDHGIFIRQIPLTDLWSLEHIPGMITDHTPLWFASGTFAFSPDNRMLIYKTRWSQTLQIKLETGEVSGL